MAEIGGQKKRKQAKVVGEETEGEKEEEAREHAAPKSKPKAKKKKIKLSFEEAGEE